MYEIKYLTEAHLRGFEKYKYNSIDTSYLSNYIMHPFWNWCVQFFPIWVAPNLITFSGFLLNILAFLLVSYYDWNFTAANFSYEVIPNWVWLATAIAIFTAYTLDGIDGKQARRTGTSGPLGELFDHGIDSYTTTLITLNMYSLFGTDTFPVMHMYWMTYLVFQNFYSSHFEKYITNIMFLPWAFDFTLWGVTLCFILTFFVGNTIWVTQMFGLYPSQLFEIFLTLSSIITNHPIVAYNIYKSYKNGTGKMRSFEEGVRPLFPLISLLAITYFWVIFSRNDILNIEPKTFFLLMGTIFSNISCRLIVAQMSDTRTDGFNILLWPLWVVVLVCTFPFYENIFGTDLMENFEIWLLYGLTIFVTIAHIHYARGIVCEMCDHFKIKCFKVRNYNPLGNNSTNNLSYNNKEFDKKKY